MLEDQPSDQVGCYSSLPGDIIQGKGMDAGLSHTVAEHPKPCILIRALGSFCV